MRSVAVEAEAALATVWQRQIDPAAFEAPVDLIDHLGKRRRGQPREQSAAGRETAVGVHQMLTARAHGGEL